MLVKLKTGMLLHVMQLAPTPVQSSAQDSPRVHLIADQLNQAWPHRQHPIFLFFAGYQGSGKTTMIEKLGEQYDFAVISNDRIRQALIDQMIFPGSPDFDRLYNKIFQFLLTSAINRKLPIILDANAHKERKVEIGKKLTAYQTAEIYLKTSVGTLEKRLQQREKRPGVYQGTVQEMHGSLNKTIEEKEYDVIETDNMTEEAVYAAVHEVVKPLNPLTKDPVLNEYLALKEYSEELETRAEIDCSEALRYCDKTKCWLARDDNRFKLSTQPDFINASRITFEGWEIIAAQGPTEITQANFIQMLKDLKSTLVLNLTQTGEIFDYWPPQGTVEMDPPFVFKKWEEIDSCQLHFLEWKDGSALELGHLYHLALCINKYQEICHVVTHCKGGIGRTGTAFAAAWMLKKFRKYLEAGKDPKTFDPPIFDMVKHLRSQRNYMVHTERQYRSVYAFRDFLRGFTAEMLHQDFDLIPSKQL